MAYDIRHLFLYLFAICICFGELYVQVFCPFINWIVCFLNAEFKSSLYILDTSPLSTMTFGKIFSQSVAFLLILLTLFNFVPSSCVSCRPTAPYLPVRAAKQPDQLWYVHKHII